MGRLIDADRLIEAFKSDLQHLQSIDADTADLLIMDIEEAPTAYDADKVVEQLEELKAERDKQYKTASTVEGSYMLSKCFSEASRAYKKSIDIVKGAVKE